MKDFYEEANKIVESIKALDFKEIGWLLEQAEKVERYEKALKECIEQDGLMKFLDDNDWAISEDYFVKLAKDALYEKVNPTPNSSIDSHFKRIIDILEGK